eukprot:scaffold10226_cov124-Isochrysis_galbana.AAC.4
MQGQARVRIGDALRNGRAGGRQANTGGAHINGKERWERQPGDAASIGKRGRGEDDTGREAQGARQGRCTRERLVKRMVTPHPAPRAEGKEAQGRCRCELGVKAREAQGRCRCERGVKAREAQGRCRCEWECEGKRGTGALRCEWGVKAKEAQGRCGCERGVKAREAQGRCWCERGAKEAKGRCWCERGVKAREAQGRCRCERGVKAKEAKGRCRCERGVKAKEAQGRCRCERGVKAKEAKGRCTGSGGVHRMGIFAPKASPLHALTFVEACPAELYSESKTEHCRSFAHATSSPNVLGTLSSPRPSASRHAPPLLALHPWPDRWKAGTTSAFSLRPHAGSCRRSTGRSSTDGQKSISAIR